MAGVSVSVLLLVLVVGGTISTSISTRPDVSEDITIPQTQDTQLGTYTGERDGQGKMTGDGNMTWLDGSSYQVR